MSKIVTIFTTLVLLLVTGCTAPGPVSVQMNGATTSSDLPSWVLNPRIEGYLCGVGTARPQKANPSYQRRVAMMQARAEIAREIEIFVRTELAMEKSCRDDACRSRIATRSRHLSRQMIGEATVKDEWKDPENGTLYIRLTVKKQTGE